MLNPNSRSLYTSALTPPPGMVLRKAIATTFSMDPTLLLEVPVYLALIAADNQTDNKDLSILEAIRRYSKHITVYVEKGRIKVPNTTNPLFGFLEEMVVEVTAPRGGVFHPKVWAIHFVNPSQESSIYRLVVLTRNMTTDKSWDLSLQLEGTIKNQKFKTNKPLAHLFELLPRMATRPIDTHRKEQTLKFAEELHRVKWELPNGFDEMTFYLPGTEDFDWKPPKAKRVAVISPFCSDDALQMLVKQTEAIDDVLVSRPEALSALREETLTLFSKCCHLDEAAETEDGEEHDATNQPFAVGLHAKAYLFESKYYSNYTHLVMGSANATNPALKTSKNIEILVGLVGKKNKIGGIDELISTDGLGEYLVDFDRINNQVTIDETRQGAEKFIEEARSCLANIHLLIWCSPGSNDDLWTLVLIGEIPSLNGIVSAYTWPITVPQKNHAVNILDNNTHDKIRLGEVSTSSVTGLMAFELKTKHPDVTIRFVLNIPIEGVPKERNSAILQTVVTNREEFFRYLILLLGDDDMVSGFNHSNSSPKLINLFYRLADGEDIPLLEELTRTYSRHPERLKEVSELIRDLSQGKQNKIIPQKFLDLWKVFEDAI